MKSEDTKTNIMIQALELFSRKGYHGVSMRDIAAAVGIRGSSIYNHYKSKQDIFEHISEFMNTYYLEQMEKIRIPTGTAKEVFPNYMDITKEQLSEYVKAMFTYFATDPYASAFFRMISIERYTSVEMAKLYEKIYYEEPVKFMKELFEELIRNGKVKYKDPEVLAIQFYAPFFLMLNFYGEDPDGKKLEKIRKQIDDYVGLFIDQYQCL